MSYSKISLCKVLIHEMQLIPQKIHLTHETVLTLSIGRLLESEKLQQFSSNLLLDSGRHPVNTLSGKWAAECAQSELLNLNIYWKVIKSPLGNDQSTKTLTIYWPYIVHCTHQHNLDVGPWYEFVKCL